MTSTTEPSRLVFPAMGTWISTTVPGGLPAELATLIPASVEAIEQRFSTWRSGTQATAVVEGRLEPAETSQQFREVLELAREWEEATGGAFTPTRPDGAVDLTGIVKAVAIQAVADLLDEAGLHDWCINAGGDVVTRGRRSDGTPWRVGIVDPEDRGRLLSQCTAPGTAPQAVATSGVAERGEHVWRLERPADAATFTQVTAVADDIVTADVLATAILAGGEETLRLVQASQRVDVLAVAADGRLFASPRFRA